ncbi:MAG: PH domain-containing protein, partial [candidate division WOR-3 bacterium]
MEWEVWLLKDNKLKGFFVIFLILLVSFLIFISYGSFFSLLSILILLFSINDFLFPIKYKIDDKKLIIEKIFWKREIDVKNIKRVEKITQGLFVSPYFRKNFLDNLRGITLFTKEREKVY